MASTLRIVLSMFCIAGLTACDAGSPPFADGGDATSMDGVSDGQADLQAVDQSFDADGIETSDANSDAAPGEAGLVDLALGARADVALAREPSAALCRAARFFYLAELQELYLSGRAICEAVGADFCTNVTSLGEGVCHAGGATLCNGVTSLGEGICRAGEGALCGSVTSLGEGICRAGEGMLCGSVASVAEGVCRAGGGSFCDGVVTLGEGICHAGGAALCNGVTTLGEGICRGAGASLCTGVQSVAEGICRAGGGFACNGVTELREGICRALGESGCTNSSVDWLLVLIGRCGVRL